MSEPSHAETVFDIKMHPENPDILASSSYDGKLKIWLLPEMKIIRTLEAPTTLNDTRKNVL